MPSGAVLVKPAVAAQVLASVAPHEQAAQQSPMDGAAHMATSSEAPRTETPEPRRFYGVVTLNPLRANRDFAEIVEHVLEHLSALPGAKAEVTVEISAHVPDGVPAAVVRTVSENARTLKFTQHGFERE